MNVNVNDISGFDATAEEIRQVYAERDRLRDENEDLKAERDAHTTLTKGILATLYCACFDSSDVKMLKHLATEVPMHYKQFRNAVMRGEIYVDKEVSTQMNRIDTKIDGFKKRAEFTEEAASILGVDPGDLSLSDVLTALRKLKREEELDEMTRETKLISLLALNPDTATWTDIYDAIKAERKDHCDLISESYKMRNELSNTKDILSGLSNTCTALKNERNEALHKLKRCEELNDMNSGIIADLKTERDTLQRYISYRLSRICSALGIEYSTDTTLSDIRKEIEKLKSWKTVAADHDRRRKNWVRKYQSEHERANSCDKLYKKYKALYDADADKREKLSDNLQLYRASYEAVKNNAVKNRSLMNTVSQIVGTVGMHDDVTMAGVQNAKKKANHWDVLVNGYGEGTMRSLLENIGVDVSGDKGNGLFG